MKIPNQMIGGPHVDPACRHATALSSSLSSVVLLRCLLYSFAENVPPSNRFQSASSSDSESKSKGVREIITLISKHPKVAHRGRLISPFAFLNNAFLLAIFAPQSSFSDGLYLPTLGRTTSTVSTTSQYTYMGTKIIPWVTGKRHQKRVKCTIFPYRCPNSSLVHRNPSVLRTIHAIFREEKHISRAGELVFSKKSIMREGPSCNSPSGGILVASGIWTYPTEVGASR